jgi:hypothetical protein
MSAEITATPDYQRLLTRISEVYTAGQVRAYQAVNTHMTATYWQIGHDIVEFEQGGKVRAEYGKALLTNLSRDLSLRHGKGFSRSNVIYMRLLYLHYAKGQKPSDLLSWSHHVELLRIDDPLERSFYEKQAILEKWSIPELKRQKKSSLFLRLATGKDKAAILRLANQGQIVDQPADILRCFVLIDLKLYDVEHHDIGQMNLYLGYFAAEENTEGDNPPIGIILTRHKDELLVQYATYEMNSQIFVQKYQLYLPNREELRRELELTLQEASREEGTQ